MNALCSILIFFLAGELSCKKKKDKLNYPELDKKKMENEHFHHLKFKNVQEQNYSQLCSQEMLAGSGNRENSAGCKKN